MGSGDVLGVVSGNDVSRSEDEVLFVLLFTLFYSIILFYVFIFFCKFIIIDLLNFDLVCTVAKASTID